MSDLTRVESRVLKGMWGHRYTLDPEGCLVHGIGLDKTLVAVFVRREALLELAAEAQDFYRDLDSA